MLSSVTALSYLNENTLSVYLSVFAIMYFGCSLIFGPKRRSFDFVGAGLLIVWVFAVIWTLIFTVIVLPR